MAKIDVTGATTVAEVKAQLAQKFETNAVNIRLMKGRKFLKNENESMASYDIVEDSMLRVVITMVPEYTSSKFMRFFC